MHDPKTETDGRRDAGPLRRLLGATGVFAIAILVSRVLGMGRESLIANRFGAGAEIDCYRAAESIPFGMGTATQTITAGALIPILSRYLRQGDEQSVAKVGGTVLSFVLVLGGVLTALGEVFARPAAGLLAPGFARPQAALTADLLRLLGPCFLFAGVGGVLSCLVLARQRFVAPAVAHVAPNVVIICCLLGFTAAMGIKSLALGLTLGTGAYMLVLLVAAKGWAKGRRMLSWQPGHEGVSRVLALALPLVAPAIGIPLLTGLERRLLSGQDPGSIASLSYGTTLVATPIGLLISSLGTVLLPILSWDAAQAERTQLARRTSIAIRLVLMVMTLVCALLLGLGRLSVISLYGSGRFDAVAVSGATSVVSWLAPLTLGVGLTEVLTKAYHAIQDTTTPVVIWCAVTAVRVGASVLAAGPMGARGLALVRGASSVVQAVLLGAGIKRVVGRHIWSDTTRLALTSALAGALITAALLLAQGLFPLATDAGRPACALRLLLLSGGATLVYTVAVLAANPRERAAILVRATGRPTPSDGPDRPDGGGHSSHGNPQ